ncbi:MAG: hypothetical protein IT374_16295 [Polyangiaceae bacterium]|nr:hypothetical protein [Polyangiaceae bacterium]
MNVALPRRAPVSDLPPGARASGTRAVASAVELEEPEDPTLRWLDRALLFDEVDEELATDPGAFVDDVARPIPEEDVTPRPTR